MNLPVAEATKCPRCGFDGPSASECPRCGIVYAKYRQGEGPSAPGSGSQPRRFTLFPWLVGLLALIALAAGFDAMRQEGPTPGEPQAMSAEPSVAEAISPRVEPPGPAAPAPDLRPVFEPEWAPLESADPVTLPEPAPDLKPTASPSYTWYEGASGFQRGIEEAQREDKALALYFYTDWCPYCRELESELLNRAKVEDFLKYLVKIRVNPESGARARALANEYGVRAYPSFFIQAAPGARPQKIRRTDSDGLKSPEEFVVTLERAAS